MGKRTRRRTRDRVDAEGRAAPGRPAQQMARVNVDAAVWTSFRVEALRVNMSVAAYLGKLVQREVDRVHRREAGPDSTGESFVNHSQ
jgi:hypothetical protein